MRRTLLIWVVLILGGVGLAHPAAAHANLIDSLPTPNTTLQTAPERIYLTFSEPVEPAFIRIKIFDSTGTVLPLDAPTVQTDAPNTVLSPFPADAPHGLYTVSWRVVSAADGHATEGAFTFAIGVRFQAGSAAVPQTDVSGFAVISRWVNLTGVAWLIGGLAAALWVSPLVSRRWLMTGWGLAGIGGSLILVNQAAISADVAPFSDQIGGAIGALMSGTAFSVAWGWRMLIWGVVGGLVWWRRRAWGLAACVPMMYAHALTSHAAAQLDRPEALIIHVIHGLAALIWIGGLAAFITVIWQTRSDSDSTVSLARLTDRFSWVGRACVGGLALTGLYSASVLVGGLEALPVTSYGRALTAKNVLFMAMLILAGVQLVFTARRLRQGESAWARVLRGLAVMELVLAGGVFAASAWMTSDMPAGEAYRLTQAAQAPDLSLTSFFDMQVIHDKMIHIDITPNVVGENDFIVTLYNPDGSPMIDASRVGLVFTHLGQLVGESRLRAEHQGYGVYRVTGANLSVPGTWRIRLSVRQPNQNDIVTDFEVTVK